MITLGAARAAAAVLAISVVAAVPVAAASGSPASAGGGSKLPYTYRVLRRDVIINADIWNRKPEMMAAGLGFTNIIGVPGLTTSNVPLSRTLTVLGGGAWNSNVRCSDGQAPPLASYTSAATPSSIRSLYGQDVYYSDGLPVEFSWPILPSSLDADDFAVTLNNGTTVTPQVVSIWPNFEYNERSVAVMFGHFGNRVPPGQAGAIYPVSVRVVRGSSVAQAGRPGSADRQRRRVLGPDPRLALHRARRAPGPARRPDAGRGQAEQDVGGGQHRAADLPAEPAQLGCEPVRPPG